MDLSFAFPAEHVLFVFHRRIATHVGLLLGSRVLRFVRISHLVLLASARRITLPFWRRCVGSAGEAARQAAVDRQAGARSRGHLRSEENYRIADMFGQHAGFEQIPLAVVLL